MHHVHQVRDVLPPEWWLYVTELLSYTCVLLSCVYCVAMRVDAHAHMYEAGGMHRRTCWHAKMKAWYTSVTHVGEVFVTARPYTHMYTHIYTHMCSTHVWPSYERYTLQPLILLQARKDHSAGGFGVCLVGENCGQRGERGVATREDGGGKVDAFDVMLCDTWQIKCHGRLHVVDTVKNSQEDVCLSVATHVLEFLSLSELCVWCSQETCGATTEKGRGETKESLEESKRQTEIAKEKMSSIYNAIKTSDWFFLIQSRHGYVRIMSHLLLVQQ